MANRNLHDIAEKMRDIDIAFLTTRTDGGELAARPMSNNSDVEYDGDSFYFTEDSARMVGDIQRDPMVGLQFSGKDGFFVAVEGRADLIRDKQAFAEHWSPDLDAWFKEGVDTPGLVMIKVGAQRIKYWDGEENGEVAL
jgi:general stress protein 26